ncbi:hypothetical protein ACPB9J_33730 [Streptomyces lavendulocolor]|uniref:hypothetical protein n=1 Tax=Streptomyces lavendulocolor TaxID=67316 RepID=UPI003C303E63
MPNQPAPSDDYEWPTCTTPTCQRALWTDELHRHACRPCQIKTRTRLADLPGLYTQLDTTAQHMRGTRPSHGTPSGTKTPPLPLRLDVVNLTGPGGIAARLQAIEDAWRTALGRRIGTWAGSPAQAVPQHVDFLIINLERVCETYDSVGQDIDDIRRLHAETLAALTGDPRPGRVDIGPCPTPHPDGSGTVCGQPLTATTNNHRIHCHTCGTRWEGLHDWQALRRAQQNLAVAGAAA